MSLEKITSVYTEMMVSHVSRTSQVQIQREYKNKICKIFKENGLNITVACNLAVTDFLDVTITDLKSGTYPYRKQKNEILYIQSNQTLHHP